MWISKHVSAPIFALGNILNAVKGLLLQLLRKVRHQLPCLINARVREYRQNLIPAVTGRKTPNGVEAPVRIFAECPEDFHRCLWSQGLVQKIESER